MYEVELKVRADHDAVRDRLDQLGASAAGTVEQVDTYYDAPHRDFAATDEALRLRRETTADAATTHITYKGPLVEVASKTREEFETTVGDDDTAAAILDALGFTPAATVEKHRERYRYDEFTVTLDDVAGLGTFVEVDAEAREADIDATRERARDLLTDLGLDPDDQIRTSYLGLLLEDASDA
jgi:adenylate cyclase class 2